MQHHTSSSPHVHQPDNNAPNATAKGTSRPLAVLQDRQRLGCLRRLTDGERRYGPVAAAAWALRCNTRSTASQSNSYSQQARATAYAPGNAAPAASRHNMHSKLPSALHHQSQSTNHTVAQQPEHSRPADQPPPHPPPHQQAASSRSFPQQSSLALTTGHADMLQTTN